MSSKSQIFSGTLITMKSIIRRAKHIGLHSVLCTISAF